MVVDRTLETAYHWASASADYPTDPAAKLLTGILDDEDGLDYTVPFVDGTVRPKDQDIVTRHLGELGGKSSKSPP